MKISFKILLNGDFKPLFLKKKVDFDRKYHRRLLRQSIIDMFSKLFYPLNINVKVTDFKYTKVAKSGIVVYLTSELNTYEKPDLKSIEMDMRRYNIHPEFVRQVRVLKID